MSHGTSRRPPPRVILQDIREFTVQIRDPARGRIVGTGVVISRGGIVATCAHVVRACGVEPLASREAQVEVYFPAVNHRSRLSEVRPAWVAAAFTDSEDDLVCLQVEGDLPLPADRVAVLGTAVESQWNSFRSYGYRQLEGYIGAWARGVILGEVEPPVGRHLLLDPVQLESSQIDAGMSGAAVLDIERNLVVGVVSETWIAETVTGKDRDTAWAVNAQVLDFSPLRVDLRSDSLPLAAAEPARVKPDLLGRAARVPAGRRMDSAPVPLPEWVGRDTLLDELDRAAGDAESLVVALVGFGGEGKSSLARRWVDRATGGGATGTFSDVFWWSFTERASADDFFEAALEFVSGGRISSGELPDGRARAESVAALLELRPFLFVLDGLEVMQHQTGDYYGTLRSADLHDFLTFFATPGHRSFCLITTRAPVLDLVRYVTCQQVDVPPLSLAAGTTLLRKLGIDGPDSSLERLVRDWEGHALTLSLIAAILTKRHQGEIRRVASLPAPDPSLSRDQQLRQVLLDYDACLSDAERSFLTRYSVFRVAVPDEALRHVLPERPWEEADTEWQQARTVMFQHLLAARILRRDVAGRTGMHPLVRDFFETRATDREQRRALHLRAMRYFLGTTDEPAQRRTLEELEPTVEAIHHACGGGDYEAAGNLVHAVLYAGERGLITRELGAYETALSVFGEFYPDGELMRLPLMRDSASRGWVQHEVATCLQMLGRLREAGVATRRAMQAFKAVGAWHDAAVSCQNLAELYLSLGALPACGAIVTEAFALAERSADQEDVLVAETLGGALAHFEGRTEEAGRAFAEALRIAREHTPIPALYSSSGTRYAEHLRRVGQDDAARRVHRTNLTVCRAAGWRGDEVSCLVGLGDLALDRGDAAAARRAYDEGLLLARGITRRDVLIRAMLGACRWELRFGTPGTVPDVQLAPALRMAVADGYRIAEIEGRMLLAQLHRRSGENESAWAELALAEQMSVEIGYHWGQHDVRAILRELGGEGGG
ncbi:trypsin-like peptidase domain-containing protein [Streptomyces sp. NPDC047123]|uniref:trypsin-like peptidase domain-containing protein n=1 Tax=Streptomyces sp. NPDC047123 TaxID=3155622 RepID=UPI0033FAFF6C